MPSDTLGERARLAVELALTARHADRPLRERQEADARRLGMVGAEIDAARLGRGFDAAPPARSRWRPHPTATARSGGKAPSAPASPSATASPSRRSPPASPPECAAVPADALAWPALDRWTPVGPRLAGWPVTAGRLLLAVARLAVALLFKDHHGDLLHRGEPLHAEVLLRVV
jgi:hypothetical protein